MAQEFTTTVGRVVWGHPCKQRVKTDQVTRQPVMGTDGQPRKQVSFGVAFPKAEFEHYMRGYFNAEAASGYPAGVPRNFAWKIIDGDGVDNAGKPYAQREGYAGHFVVSFSTEGAPPSVVKLNPATGTYDQLPVEGVKCGDYVTVATLLKLAMPTQPTHVPSLYVNPRMVEFVGYGTEIVSANAPDPTTAFGGRQHQLPPGASAVPLATTGAVAPPVPPMAGQPGMMPPPAAPAAYAPPPAPLAAPPPPPAPMAAPPPPPPPAPVAVDPMAAAAADGWLAHPQAPGHFYKGEDVKAAADLAAMYAAAPAGNFVAGQGTYPGQPGMMPPR